MSTVVSQALQVMAIGLPIMFMVILLLMLVAKVLVMILPEKEEGNEVPK